jgi:N-carbamoylputrescine amidase
MREVTVAATQMACEWDRRRNLERAEHLVRTAAGRGARVILLQELFETPYFCKDQDRRHFGLAQPLEGSPLIAKMSRLASELGVVLPISFFERANNAYFNSLTVIDADGRVLGVYRKSHIPDGPGYQEKFYFNLGDTGFRVWQTKAGVIGVGICWDQWFPEAARIMALLGAELIFYPTAIGSEPHDPSLDTSRLWRRAMVGHAVSNVVPVVASNRIGNEEGQIFYGHSFICDERGDMLAEFGKEETGVLVATLDIDRIRRHRAAFGFFRDRRPDLYGRLAQDI